MFAMGPAFFRPTVSGYATLAMTGTFSAATVGVAYSSSIPISGGLEPYSLTGGTGVASGSLDSGFSLSITGTTGARFLTLSCASPTTADTMTFTASVDSSDGQTATSAQSVTVSAADFAILSGTDKAPEITITGDLTATRNAGAGAWKGVRATKAKGAGKWYFEVQLGSNGSANGSLIVGLAAAIDPLTYPGAGPYAYGAQPNDVNTGNVGTYNNGVYYSNAYARGSVGDTCCFAVDLDGHRVWFRFVGRAWMNGDPATGTGGYVLTTGVSLLPMIGEYSAPQQATANFGATAFAGVVPSGFHAGWF